MPRQQVSGTAIIAAPAERIFELLTDPAQHPRPLDDGADGADGARTEVTETFDWSTARWPLLLTLSPFPRRNRLGIAKSLDRLAHIATASGQ